MSTPLKKALILLVVSAFVAGFSHGGKGPAAGGEPGLEMRLPFVLNEWTGTPGEAGPAEKRMLPPDTEIKKMIYRPRAANVDPMQVTIVLSGKDRTSIHRPEVCLAAQGWNIKTSETKSVKLDNGKILSVRELGITREIADENREVSGRYTYWFVGTNSTTEDHLKRIVFTATNNLIHGSNPRWSYISVLSVGDNNDSASRWIAEAAPQFQRVFEPASLF